MVRTYFQSRTEFKENNPLKNPLSSMVYSSDGTCWGRIKENTLPSSFEYLYTGWDCRPYGGKMQRGSIYIEIIQNSNFVRKKNEEKLSIQQEKQ